MSILIDKLFKYPLKNCVCEYKDGWFIAKPLQPKRGLGKSLSDAIRVLRQKSFAVHFKIDEQRKV